MSFNNNDNKPLTISLTNYEEYFLMYVDDELTADEKKAVEKFIVEQPQLSEELELLVSTKLTGEELRFENKESLLASNMQLNAFEEKLLLYIDDELPKGEKEALEKRLQTASKVQTEYHLLLKTKLDKSEEIIYPYKKELYRGRKLDKPIFWMRIAAAVLIVAGAGVLTLYNNGNNGNNPAPTVAQTENRPKVNQSTTPAITKENTIAEQPVAVTTDDNNTIAQTGKEIKKAAPEKHTAKQLSIDLPPVNNDVIARVENKKEIDAVTPDQVTPSITRTVQTENNFKTGVTTATTAAYNPVEASDNDIIDAVATSENKKGRAIRGFLRKATRFIERTTNIDPVNEDDKLLIGAVALKLK
jgi:anti-sigma factor RsiW